MAEIRGLVGVHGRSERGFSCGPSGFRRLQRAGLFLRQYQSEITMGRSLAGVLTLVALVTAAACDRQPSGQGSAGDPQEPGEMIEVTAAAPAQQAPASEPTVVREPAVEAPVEAAPVPVEETPVVAASPTVPAQPPAAAPSSTGAADPVSIQSGVYTTAQATRGRQVAQRECNACHSPTEWSSGGIVVGWNGRSVFELTSHIRSIMPLDGPGRLPWQAYTDIVAYMLQLNRVPPGERELPTDETELSAIVIERG